MGDCDFRPPGAPKPLNRSSWNLAWLITSSTRPHMPKLIHAALGVQGGVGVKLPPRVLFKIFFDCKQLQYMIQHRTVLIKRCLHYHTCTAYRHAVHVRRTCMIVQTCTAYMYVVHVRRIPIRSTCTTYMCDSVNIHRTCIRHTCMIV